MWRTERIGFQAEWSESAKALRLPVGSAYRNVFMHAYYSLLCLYLKTGGQVGLCGFHKMERSVSLIVTLPKGVYLCVPPNKTLLSIYMCQGQCGYSEGPSHAFEDLSAKSEQSRTAQCGTCTSRGLCWYNSQKATPGTWRAGLLRDPEEGHSSRRGMWDRAAQGQGPTRNWELEQRERPALW